MGNVLARINSCRHRLKNLSNVFEGREPRVLILGIDGAGKTALLYKAKLDDAIFANVPPRGINIELMTPRRGARLQVYDLPGNKLTRYLWHNWFMSTEAVVYVVDSADRVRIDEAKFELHELLQSRALRRVPLIVVANKQDAHGAMGTDEVSMELDLSIIQDRDWSIHATCAEKGSGNMKAFQDVVDKIKAFRHYKSSLTVKDTEGNKKAEKSKDIQEKTDLKLTSIEVIDANDNEKIPSLFDSINKQTELKDELAETELKYEVAETDSTANSSGTSDSNPPEYDRPSNIGQGETEISSNERASPDEIIDVDNHDDLVIDKAMRNVKVTDLDVDSIETDTENASSDENGTETNSVYEFEPNAPVAVV